jgi:hypothetical protein
MTEHVLKKQAGEELLICPACPNDLFLSAEDHDVRLAMGDVKVVRRDLDEGG